MSEFTSECVCPIHCINNRQKRDILTDPLYICDILPIPTDITIIGNVNVGLDMLEKLSFFLIKVIEIKELV